MACVSRVLFSRCCIVGKSFSGDRGYRIPIFLPVRFSCGPRGLCAVPSSLGPGQEPPVCLGSVMLVLSCRLRRAGVSIDGCFGLCGGLRELFGGSIGIS